MQCHTECDSIVNIHINLEYESCDAVTAILTKKVPVRSADIIMAADILPERAKECIIEGLHSLIKLNMITLAMIAYSGHLRLSSTSSP